MSKVAITHMEQTLIRLHGWQGWTYRERAVIQDMAAQMDLLGRKYESRLEVMERGKSLRRRR